MREDPKPQVPDVIGWQVRTATAEDAAGLTGVLARAFAHDPFVEWLVVGEARRMERIRRVFDWFVRRALPHGLSSTTADHSGAALWIPPGKWTLSLVDQVRLLPEMLRVTGLRRAASRMHGIDVVQRRHPEAPHYYLAAIGTEPALQRRGIGSALLQPVLQRCDRAGMPAYLESSNERNLPLYQRHGFRVADVVVLPHAGPKIWLMWREPSS